MPLQLNATHLYPHLAALRMKCLRYLSCDPPAMPLMRMSTGASSGIVRQCSASRLRSTVRPWSGMARRNGGAVASKSTSHPVPPLPHPPAPPPPATPITPGTPSGDNAESPGPPANAFVLEPAADAPYCNCAMMSSIRSRSRLASRSSARRLSSSFTTTAPSDAIVFSTSSSPGYGGTAIGQSRVTCPPSGIRSTSRWYSMGRFSRSSDATMVHACLFLRTSTASYGS